jgi:hypothetical protein
MKVAKKWDCAGDISTCGRKWEMVYAIISSASCEGLSVQKRLEGFSQELERFLRGLIEELRKQDSAKARRFEEKLGKLIRTFRKMDEELALVSSQSEIGQILKKYWAILSGC